MFTANLLSWRARKILLPLMLVSVFPAGQALASTFNYPNFSSVSGLTLNGNAAQSGSVLRVVPNVLSQAGTAFGTTAVPLDSNTGFSTSFEFNVTTDAGNPTDGFAFLLQSTSDGASALGAAGQGLGYVGLTPSTAVVFRGRGPSFIGLINGGIDPADPSINFAPPGSVSETEGVFYNQNEFAWIDYNPTTTSLSVYLSTSSTKPSTATMTATVDLFGNLGAPAYVGFSAGTGGGFGNVDILNWSFNSSEVPEPATLGVLGMGLAMFGLARRRSRG